MIELIETIALVAFVVALPISGAYHWPEFVRAAKAGEPGVRMRAYREVLLAQWSLTIVLLACWTVAERPWDRLGLGMPSRAAAIGIVCALVLAALSWLQVRKLRAADEQTLTLVRTQLGDVGELLPHDAREHRWFRAVAFTAGFCEEVTYRGILPLALAAWLPTPSAIVAATLLFGIGHAYQGASSILKVTLVGGVMAGITVLTDSLWSAIALHAVLDLHGGAIGYAVWSTRKDEV